MHKQQGTKIRHSNVFPRSSTIASLAESWKLRKLSKIRGGGVCEPEQRLV